MRKYNIELARKLNLIECVVCHQRLEAHKLTHIEDINEIQSNIFADLIEKENIVFPCYICKPYCLNDIKNDEIPTYSILNNMKLSQPPECISKLNHFERNLTQIAKCFQTIVKLKPYRFSTNNCKDLVPAMKGVAIHLPLPLNETHKHVSNTLPSASSLSIVVNSLPTKDKTIWQSMVNLNKVYDALEFLKQNNKHYEEIKFDKNTTIAVNIDENEDSLSESELQD